MAAPPRWRSELRPAWLAFQRWLRPAGRTITLNGRPLRLDPAVSLPKGDAVEYEPLFLNAFLDAIQPGHVVFDIGANQGLHTVLGAKKVGESGRVFSFEASPAALDVLQRMTRLNNVTDRVEVVAGLVAAKAGGVAPFHCAETAVGWASAAYKPPGTHQLLIPTTTVDTFAATRGTLPHIIKIDVEGFEGEVLAGARETLRIARPTVFCAMHPEILATLQTSVEAIVAVMKDCGYRALTSDAKPVDSSVETEVVFIPD